MRLQAGKPKRQSLATVHDCPISTGRLFITELSSKLQFLIDTRSDLCVLSGERRRGRVVTGGPGVVLM